MGKPQRRFGKEFAAEAVRLVEVSGRTQREIARDLGVGLSTLRRWLDKRREHEIEAPPPERQEDLAAELKRLRRENEILRQEREILKRAATFFAKEGSRWGLSGILCARQVVSSRLNEPFVEHDGELCLRLEPLARRHFPFSCGLAQDEKQELRRRVIGWKMTSRAHGAA